MKRVDVYPIPDEALPNHIAILGKTGSGKSNAAATLIERLMARGERVCLIDPMDRYWGLRLSADGCKPSPFRPVIFGGAHADMPLAEHHRKTLAEVIATSTTPTVVSTRHMTVGERSRFFTGFAEALLRCNQGPLHLVIDEAHLFAPKHGAAGNGVVPAMLHAANNLVSLGRGVGLRIILISQRPAKLHNDSLGQVETLIAFRLLLPHDRNAVRDWIREAADEKTGADLLASLPSLSTGEAWLWAPSLDILRRVQFPLVSTFDSGKPLPVGQVPALQPIDLEALRGKLEQVAQDAMANDPDRLKRRVAELEAELRKRPAGSDAELDRLRGELAQRDHESALLSDQVRQRQTAIEGALRELRFFAGAEVPVAVTRPPPASPMLVECDPPARDLPDRVHAARKPGNGAAAAPAGDLPKGLRIVLTATAQHRGGVTRQQLTQLTGYKRSSRDAYVSRLREKGLLELEGDRLVATAAGVAALGHDYEPLPVGDDLRRYWLDRLPEGERTILSAVIEFWPAPATRQLISDRTNYKRSSRDAYVSRLAARELVIVSRDGGVKASDLLFGERRS